MMIKQLSVFVENKPGRVSAIVSSLADKGVNLSALSLADTVDFGIMRMIVDNAPLATETLRHDGVAFKMTDVLAVHLDDQPGGLSTVLTVLSRAGISVNYMYAFISKVEGAAIMVLSVPDPHSAEALLRSNGFTDGQVNG